MIHAAPPMSVIAVSIIVLQVWYLLQPPWHPVLVYCTDRLSSKTKFALVVLPPYLTYIAITIAVIWRGLQDPSAVTPALGLYCTIIDLDTFFSTPIFCAVFMIMITLFNLGTMVQFLWRRCKLKRVNPLASRTDSVNIWVRVFIFNLYSLLTLGACLILIFTKSSPLPYVVQAALPLVALLIFGTQTDIWFAIRDWRCGDRIRVSDGGWSIPANRSPTSSQLSLV
ncbi:hypothetical protein QCA50_002469 [Cerrena zonata]|uniref:G protein-coupled receptor n=1 Tax=Cerrena zonata TaxID=2478898 RepID=A0AAW0GTN5_9APHY